MESDVFYDAIKTNDDFYEFELFCFCFKTRYATLSGFDLIMWYKASFKIKY